MCVYVCMYTFVCLFIYLDLLYIVPDEDISVGFRLCVGLVSRRLVRCELQSLCRS